MCSTTMTQPFTRNYNDHSNDSGFQFEFHCDKCGNGYRSTFTANKIGMAAGFLHAAGSIFGGALNNAGWGADHVKDALRGPAWDSAFSAAVDEIRPKFHQCTRCGRWVCPEVCWNATRGMCEECAPDLREAAVAAQAQVAAEQVWQKARDTDQTQGMSMQEQHSIGGQCAKCNSRVEAAAKFCAGCGTPVAQAPRAFCTQCAQPRTPGARFCAGCGAPAT
jgi:hypothetical protein